MEQIDNTEFLLAASDIQTVAIAVVKQLRTGVEGEQQKAISEMICFVIETQSDVIRRFVERQLELTDRLEDLMRKIEEAR